MRRGRRGGRRQQGRRELRHAVPRLQAVHDHLRRGKKLCRDTITAEDSGEFVPVMGFDCRGLEITK